MSSVFGYYGYYFEHRCMRNLCIQINFSILMGLQELYLTLHMHLTTISAYIPLEEFKVSMV